MYTQTLNNYIGLFIKILFKIELSVIVCMHFFWNMLYIPFQNF